jgi:uncharacterized protein YgfB (UPF0149 family)
MRFSRVGTIVLILTTVLIGANCSYYNQIIARKNLVDGGKAYKNRKFQEAEQLFRDAISRDPNGDNIEGRTAQLFLARTLHSVYIGNRSNTATAEEAIGEYKKVLAKDIADNSSFKAVANLLENLGKQDEWLKWITDRTNDEKVPPEQRAEALTSLAAKQYTCANDISDTDAVKKEIKIDGKPAYQFVKPTNPADFEQLKQCTQKGMEIIDRAVKLDSNSDSVWSYKANMLIQQMRIAEMEGNTASKDALKAEAETAKNKFTELAKIKKDKADALEAEQKAKEEEANKNKK